MRRKTAGNNKHLGFTIIELLIATLVFSVLLIVMLAAFIRTGDLFYKGVSMMKTQDDARNIVQSISDDIQFTQAPPTFVNGGAKLAATYTLPDAGRFCIGNNRYSYQIAQQVGVSGNYGMVRDTVPAADGCPVNSNPATGTDATQMLDSGMQLNALTVDCSAANRCEVSIHVIFYGVGSTPDSFSTSTPGFSTNAYKAPDAQCTGSLNDSNLCATVDYDSTVLENNN